MPARQLPPCPPRFNDQFADADARRRRDEPDDRRRYVVRLQYFVRLLPAASGSGHSRVDPAWTNGSDANIGVQIPRVQSVEIPNGGGFRRAVETFVGKPLNSCPRCDVDDVAFIRFLHQSDDASRQIDRRQCVDGHHLIQFVIVETSRAIACYTGCRDEDFRRLQRFDPRKQCLDIFPLRQIRLESGAGTRITEAQVDVVGDGSKFFGATPDDERRIADLRERFCARSADASRCSGDQGQWRVGAALRAAGFIRCLNEVRH